MKRYGLIDVLSDYCRSNGIYFICGNDAYVNAVADRHVYDKNELILIAELDMDVNLNGKFVSSVDYKGTIAIGRKCEDTETSSLDETFMQKYKARLRELCDLLVSLLTEISCQNEGTINSLSLKYDINKFDLNADFVAGSIDISFNE